MTKPVGSENFDYSNKLPKIGESTEFDTDDTELSEEARAVINETPTPETKRPPSETLDNRVTKGSIDPVLDQNAQNIAKAQDIVPKHPSREQFARLKNQDRFFSRPPSLESLLSKSRESSSSRTETDSETETTDSEISESDLKIPSVMPKADLNDKEACTNIILPHAKEMFQRSKSLQYLAELLSSTYKESKNRDELLNTKNSLNNEIKGSIDNLNEMCKNITFTDKENNVKQMDVKLLIKLYNSMAPKHGTSQYEALANIKNAASNFMTSKTSIELLDDAKYLEKTGTTIKLEAEYKTKINDQITNNKLIDDNFVDSLIGNKIDIIKNQKRIEFIKAKKRIEGSEKHFRVKSDTDAATVTKKKSLLNLDKTAVREDIRKDIVINLEVNKTALINSYDNNLKALITSNKDNNEIVDELLEQKKAILVTDNKIQQIHNSEETSTKETTVKKLICKDIEHLYDRKINDLLTKKGRIEDEGTTEEKEIDDQIKNLRTKIKDLRNYASSL